MIYRDFHTEMSYNLDSLPGMSSLDFHTEMSYNLDSLPGMSSLDSHTEMSYLNSHTEMSYLDFYPEISHLECGSCVTINGLGMQLLLKVLNFIFCTLPILYTIILKVHSLISYGIHESHVLTTFRLYSIR